MWLRLISTQISLDCLPFIFCGTLFALSLSPFSFLVCTPSFQNSFLARCYWYRVSVIQMERDQYFGTANISGGCMQPWRFLCNKCAGSLTKDGGGFSVIIKLYFLYLVFIAESELISCGATAFAIEVITVQNVLSELEFTTLKTRPSPLKPRY